MSQSIKRTLRIAGAMCCAIVTLWGIGGCASSPRVEYFALEPIEAHGAVAAALSTPIQVARVHLPPTLDRKQMVRHSGAYTVDISDQHRWSAPLEEMIRRVLSQDLMHLLPRGSVVLPEEPAPPSTRKIVMSVLEFAPNAGGTIRFEATWSLISPAPGVPPENRDVRLSEPSAANDPAGQVKSMSRVIERLAALMAKAVSAP